MRATISSINTAIGRLWSIFFFILLKVLMDDVSIQTPFVVCLIIFIFASFPLKWVHKISLIEEKRN